MWSTLWAIAEDTCIDIAFGRELVIKNKRLGILNKVLVIIAIIIVSAYLIHTEVWYGRFYGSNMGVIVWPSGAQDVAAQENYHVEHCEDLDQYRYRYSEYYTYQPRTCKVLSQGKAFIKMGTRIFVPTLITDSKVRRTRGAEECASLEQTCATIANNSVFNPSVEALYRQSYTDMCSCSWSEQYFARNPEEMSISFLHGFQVPLSSDRRTVMRGVAASGEIEEGLIYDTQASPGDVMTILQKPDGSRCEIGGRSQFMPNDVGTGITGKISEWIACAGVTLDSNPNLILQDENMPPHIRTMGGVITLHMSWTNRFSRRSVPSSVQVICYITVALRPAWNTMALRDSGQSPGNDEWDITTVFRTAGGLGVEFDSGGVFYFFRFENLLTGIVSAVVIMNLPATIIKFVILYCMGLVSTIYRNAQRKPLKIYANFHGVIARMFITASLFRGLLLRREKQPRIWDETVCEKKGLTRLDLSQHVKDVLAHWVMSGDLSSEELATLVAVVLEGLDSGHNDEVNLNEFVHACTSTDTMTMNDMTMFFKSSRHRGFCEKFFDSSHRKKKKVKDAGSKSEDAGLLGVGGLLGGGIVGSALQDLQENLESLEQDIGVEGEEPDGEDKDGAF